MKKRLTIYGNSVFQLALTILAYVPSIAIRKAILRLCGAKLAPGVLIYHGFDIRSPWKLTIGEGSVIGHKDSLDARALTHPNAARL